MSEVQTSYRRTSMARYRLLSIVITLQVREINEEIDRRVSHIWPTRDEADDSLPFYQDKLHEEKVFQRFNEILTKVSHPFRSRRKLMV
jgi:hypothetical protein